MDVIFLPPTFSPRPAGFFGRPFWRAAAYGAVALGVWCVIALALLMLFTPFAHAQTVTEAPVAVQPWWVVALQPVVGALVLAVAGIAATLISGLGAKLSAYLVTNKQAAAASMVADANTVIHAALMTGASTIAGKIQTGQLDYTNRAAWEAEAQREVTLVQQRVPGAIATAAPVAGALLASLMAKVDALQVSATPLVAPPVPVTIAQAAAVINDTKAALASLTPGAVA
jgi:hypothetical protein